MYAFINFNTSQAALEFKKRWHKKRLPCFYNQQCLNISFSDVQGRDEHLRQLRKKRLSQTKDKMSQPLIFRNDERIPLKIALAELDIGHSSLADHMAPECQRKALAEMLLNAAPDAYFD